MHANLKSISDLLRFTLPAIVATLLVSGPALAQHYDFDTRYRPSTTASPWHSQQAFPHGFHQLEGPSLAAPPIVEATPSQPVIQPMMIEPQHTLTAPPASDILAIPPHPVASAVESPMTQTPMTNAEATLSTQWGHGIPEGYDPAYPIEYPGANFQGFYPVDGVVVAPLSDNISAEPLPSQTVSDSPTDVDSSSSGPEAPMIPSVVVADSVGEVMMPPPETINRSTGQTSNLYRESSTELDELSTEKMLEETAKGDTKSESELIRKLKQRLQAADLRTREAEEKAMAIARQASENQKQLDQLKAQTAESNSSMAQANSQKKALLKKIARLKTELDSSNEAVKRMKSQATKNQKMMKPLKANPPQPNASMKQPEAQDAGATLQLDQPYIETIGSDEATPANALESADASKSANNRKSVVDPNPTAETTAADNSRKTKRDKTSTENKPTEKIAALETARDKQLASTAARIESDFQAKIDAKLESGKTTSHPEVKALKNLLQRRLKESDKNIRRRYQRQINKILKEAAARSRS